MYARSAVNSVAMIGAGSSGDHSNDSSLAASTVSRALVLLRAERGLTQEALSVLSGIPRQMISAYERGVSSPTFVQLERLAASFNLRVSAMLSAGEPAESHARPNPPCIVSAHQPYAVPLYENGPPSSWESPPTGHMWIRSERISGNPERVRMVRVVNDACYPWLIEGDLVTVDIERAQPRSGGIVVCSRPGDDAGAFATFRLVNRERALEFSNPLYPPLNIDEWSIIATASMLARHLAGCDQPILRLAVDLDARP